MRDETTDSRQWYPIERKISSADLAAVLTAAPFLEDLEPEIVADLAAACELVRLDGGRRLMRQGTPNDSLYVVVHGGLRTLARDARGREHVVSESYRGDSVGMADLLSRASTPADVYAIRDSTLLRLTRESFVALGARHPQLILRIAESIVRKGLALLGQQEQWITWTRPGAAARNVALVVPNRDRHFASLASDRMRTALERHCRVGQVTHQALDAAFGAGTSSFSPGDDRGEDVLAFVQDLERDNEIVLYECDTAMPPWCERCLGQADRVLCIVRADRPEHIAEIREVLEPTIYREQAPQLDLVLDHATGTVVPSGVARRASLFPRAHIHNVRSDNPGDYERLARTIIRAGIALVLSGGGARGIAHVGVLKAFEDAGIPVDAIGGTSMGSIAAAAWARGWSADTIMAKIRELMRRPGALLDPTLPFQSLLAGRKLERVLQGFFGELDIEDLWLPFFCVSTNLSGVGPHVHERGQLWRALAASCSIPGIFPPRREGADQLVDGGVVDNLPIDVMAERFEGAVVASDVNLYGEVEPPHRSQSTAGRLLDVARWLNPVSPRADRAPEILEILLRTTLVGSRRTAMAALTQGAASLYLRLPVARFGVVDWRAYDELFAVGYEYARQQLASFEPPWR